MAATVIFSHLQFPLSFFLPDRRTRGVAVPISKLVDDEWRTVQQCPSVRCHVLTAASPLCFRRTRPIV